MYTFSDETVVYLRWLDGKRAGGGGYCCCAAVPTCPGRTRDLPILRLRVHCHRYATHLATPTGVHRCNSRGNAMANGNAEATSRPYPGAPHTALHSERAETISSRAVELRNCAVRNHLAYSNHCELPKLSVRMGARCDSTFSRPGQRFATGNPLYHLSACHRHIPSAQLPGHPGPSVFEMEGSGLIK